MATITLVETKLIVTRISVEYDEAGEPTILSYEAHTVDKDGKFCRRTDGFIAQADMTGGDKGTLNGMNRAVAAHLAAWANL